jgi:hypothetical protein
LHLEAQKDFFLQMRAASFGPFAVVTDNGQLNLLGFKEMPFIDFATLDLLNSKTPLLLCLGTYGAKDGKTYDSHTGRVIRRYCGQDINLLFNDLLPFAVGSVKAFRESKGDLCFDPCKFPSSLVTKSWQRLAVAVGSTSIFVIDYRAERYYYCYYYYYYYF